MRTSGIFKAAAFAACFAFSGCMTVKYATEYGPSPEHSVATKNGGFVISDKAGEGRGIVRPSLAGAIGYGIPPRPWAMEAVKAYFGAAGRDCTITDIYMVTPPLYEFTYQCGAGP